MSEQAPRERQNPYEKPEGAKSFKLSMEGSDETIELHRANTAIYLHTLQSVGDHIFVCVEQDEQNDTLGFILWKNGIGEEAFTKILQGLSAIGIGANPSKYMTDGDVQRFIARFGCEPELDDIEIETFELTKRLGELCVHWGEILERTPDDLLYDAITTPQTSNLPQRWAQSRKVVDEDDSGAF